MFSYRQRANKEQSRNRIPKLALVISLLVLAIVTGCGNFSDSKEAEGHADHSKGQHDRLMKNDDLRQITASVDELPPFLKDKQKEMQQIYQLAATNSELLQYIPCYCGCGEVAGHKSNLNCFVASKEEGKIEWDDHGTRCGVCLDIAVEASLMLRDGKSMKEIRQTIDTKYKEGYAEPTPTPLPSV
ncbi:PCYCGC motif-containing (lipo)protein [Paenibacillus alvei]|uniref:Lipoprotein n=1 Tax=Paenibacillus alvei TaxID=44250 RepID=A0AAP6ZXS3_PAEAL|nr:PCYCGC motif-containing (lipo)protein [Paenibacillus alvei]NEZ42037.1 hypothetical protein [Paenibacillus alvei]NOJ70664.1 hypothetical protein [Paenibacillus alvei]